MLHKGCVVVTGGAAAEGFLPSTDFDLCSWLLVAEARQVGWLLINVFFIWPNKQRIMITGLICCCLISSLKK